MSIPEWLARAPLAPEAKQDFLAFAAEAEANATEWKAEAVATAAAAPEVKAIADELAQTVQAERKALEALAEEVKAKGAADVLTQEKLDRITAAVAAQQAKMDELIVRAARPMAHAPDAPEVKAAELFSVISGRHIDAAGYAEFKAAFDAYARKGHMAAEAKAMSVAVAPDGGFLVPVELSSAIDRIATLSSGMARVVSTVTTTSSRYQKLVNIGGTGSGWVGERAARPETDTPRLDRIEPPMGEVYANPFATQNLLDDASIDVSAWLSDEIAIEFARQEGDAFVNGTGSDKPRGLLAEPKVANASWSWGSIGFIAAGGASFPAAPNQADPLIDVMTALRTPYLPNARWMMNRTTLAAVRKLKGTTGDYYWVADFSQGPGGQLLGFPVEIDDFMPSIGSGVDAIAFGDFARAYTIVRRQGVRIVRDELSMKPYVQFYSTQRVGGAVTNYEAVKLLRFSA